MPPEITSFPFDLDPGISIDIQVQFAPTSVGNPLSSFVSIVSNNAIPNFLYQVSGEGIAASPLMEVFGNGNLISSGDVTPSVTDHTIFDDADISGSGTTRTFTIENNGTADLSLTSLSPIVRITGTDAGDFTVTTNPSTPIAPDDFTTFTITFDPSTTGTKTAVVEIDNNSATDPYTFTIQGEAIDGGTGGFNQLMITQYYDGINAFDNWIEIKNISGTTTIGRCL